MSIFLLSATGCNEQLKRMESNQIVLEEKIDQNSRQALALARKMERSQGLLEVRIDRVQEGSNVALAETRATRYEQEKLREDTRQFNRKWTAGIMRVEEHQRHLQDSVNGVAGTATVIDEGVQKLDAGQDAGRSQMAANQKETQASFAQVRVGQTELIHAAAEAVGDLIRGQQGITAVATEGVAATGRVSRQVAGVQGSQDAQTGILREHHQAMIAKVDGVASDQQRFQRSTRRQVQQLSQKVTSGQKDQKRAHTQQSDLVGQRADAIDASLKTAQKNQEDLSLQIRGHHDYAVDLGSHVTAIKEEQKRMNDSIRQGNRTVDSAVQAVGENQKKFERTLKHVESTTVATNEQAGAIADKQSEFHTLEGQRHSRVLQAAAGLEASHNKAQGTLEDLGQKAQVIVRDTGAIRDRQSQLNQGLQQEGVHIRQGLSQLEKGVNRVEASTNTLKEMAAVDAQETQEIQDQQAELQRGVNRVEVTTSTLKEMAAADAQETQEIQDQQAELQRGVNRVEANTGTLKGMAAVGAQETQEIQDQQAELQQGLVQEGGKIRQTLAGMEENQDQLHGAVNNVQVSTNTVVSNTTTLMEQQAALQRVSHRDQAQLVESLDRMGANQEAIAQQAQTLKEGQREMAQVITDSQNVVARKVDAVSGQQNELQDAIAGVAASAEVISQDTGEIKQGQASLKTDVQAGQDGIEEKVGQVRQTQASLNRMFTREKTHLDVELKAIGESQAGLQDGLSDQKNMSTEMARQIERMQQGQTRMGQTMDQQQEAWRDQNGELAKRVAALEESLGHVDQNVSSLQTNLVSQITELTRVMKALQLQGGAQIAQLTDDMKAFNGTLKQIQATQSNLAKRIDQVGVNQAQQSIGFLTALEKLQKQTQPASAADPVEVESQEVDVVK
ncbi:MAG: hypothetical protein GY809_17015 [Planctomycetes bacterium]|nr:hypothetical protein [Planctomycetota bacterium]